MVDIPLFTKFETSQVVGLGISSINSMISKLPTSQVIFHQRSVAWVRSPGAWRRCLWHLTRRGPAALPAILFSFDVASWTRRCQWKNQWMFPKQIGVPQNGWFIMENPIEMDDLGVTLIFGNIQMVGGGVG